MVRQFDQSQHPEGLQERRAVIHGLSGHRTGPGAEKGSPGPRLGLAEGDRDPGPCDGPSEARGNFLPI